MTEHEDRPTAAPEPPGHWRFWTEPDGLERGEFVPDDREALDRMTEQARRDAQAEDLERARRRGQP